MFITNVDNRDGLESIVVAELKSHGIKFEKEKKPKTIWDDSKFMKKRIFHCHLDLLQLTDVVIANDEVIQIPKFLADAGEQILQQADTEGIFRKTGSITRQKAIIRKLDTGVPLGSSNDIIDVATIFKTFFRQLQVPLIPAKMQETMLRSLLIGENKVSSILMSCLLMPVQTIYILAFLMQLLNKIALKIVQNKMSIENLAVIFTPGIMPLSDMGGKRFNNHIKVIQILIQNANDIGIVPEPIITKLQIKDNPPLDNALIPKPRSNSLTRMLNNIKKIVGGVKSSNEIQLCNASTAPCIRGPPIKRKLPESDGAFGARKRKEILSSLPGNNALLPNAPLIKSRRVAGVRSSLKGKTTPIKIKKLDKSEVKCLSPVPITLPFNFAENNVEKQNDLKECKPSLEIKKNVAKSLTSKTTTVKSNTTLKQGQKITTVTKPLTGKKSWNQVKSPHPKEKKVHARRSLKVNNLPLHYRAYHVSGTTSTSLTSAKTNYQMK